MTHKLVALAGMLFIAMLVIAGCTGKTGPTGPSGTVDCVQCHSDDTTIMARVAQWEHSKHATGSTLNEGSRASCAGCHTSEAFVSRVDTDTSIAVDQPSPIGCFTCHAPHVNKNFTLRTEAAVTLLLGGTFDRGAGNLCVMCHQGRVPNPNPLTAPGPNVILTSSSGSVRWNPHHGPQGNILSGNGAAQIGTTAYGNSAHATVVTNGCPTCHMALPSGALAGGHSMNMVVLNPADVSDTTDWTEGCLATGCHSSMPDFNLNHVQDSVATLLSVLSDRLTANGITFDEEGAINLPPSDTLTLPLNQAKALYNFQLFEADRSTGVHNTQYTYDALNASINAFAGK